MDPMGMVQHVQPLNAQRASWWSPEPVILAAIGDLDHLIVQKISEEDPWEKPNLLKPIGSMGLIYLPTWMLDFYGFHVGKYTVRPMDPMG